MKLVTIEHNNKSYSVDVNATIEQLMTNGELMKLPLAKWLELFLLKDKRCNPYNLRRILIAKINNYDNSSAVNQFMYKGITSWLDKNTRVGLMNLANCSTENIQLVLGDNIISISPEDLKMHLAALEVYAAKCYANTANHLLEVNKLHTSEEMINYDYTIGYPEIIKVD